MPTFTPPVVEEGIETRDRLMRYFKINKAISVGVIGATVTEVRFPYAGDIPTYDHFYLGGYAHTITSSEAAVLTNAGYAANIT